MIYKLLLHGHLTFAKPAKISHSVFANVQANSRFAMVWMASENPDHSPMGFLPDTQNFALRMRRECRERFPRCRLQRKPLVCNPGMHHGTCVTHVPWCMSGSLTSGGGENVPGIPGACATRNFAYLVRGPCLHLSNLNSMLSDNGCSDILRISTHIDMTPAANHNRPY